VNLDIRACNKLLVGAAD